MKYILISHVLKKVTYCSDVATGPLQGLLGCENMMIFMIEKSENKLKNIIFIWKTVGQPLLPYEYWWKYYARSFWSTPGAPRPLK